MAQPSIATRLSNLVTNKDNHLQASSYKVLREGLFGQYIHPSQVTWDLEGGAPGLLPTRENSGLFPWKKSQWGGQGWGPGGRWPGWVAPSFNRQWGVREVFELIFFYCCFVFQFHELVTTHLLFKIIMVQTWASENNECMVPGPLRALIALMPASGSIFLALRYTHSILLKAFV